MPDAQVDELEQRLRDWGQHEAADRIAADRARIKELEANAREWERVAEETALQGITDSRKLMARIAALEAVIDDALGHLEADEPAEAAVILQTRRHHAREPNNA